MNVINLIFGADSHPAIKFSVIFFLVAFGLYLLWFIFSRLMKTMKRGGFSSRSRQPRLGVLEEIEIDNDRRLLLVRRDNVEHLIMIGGKNDFVVEQNITRAVNNALQIPQTPVYSQPIESPDEAAPSNNFRVSAKSQARIAAQVEPEPIKQEPPKVIAPKVEPPRANYAETVTNAFKQPVAPQPTMQKPLATEANPFTTIKPAAYEPLKPVEAPKRVDPPAFKQPIPIAQTTFDSLEDEMAALLGQIKK